MTRTGFLHTLIIAPLAWLFGGTGVEVWSPRPPVPGGAPPTADIDEPAPWS